jgi:regulator of RNase E activity RraA
MEVGEIKRPPKQIIEGFKQVSTSTISDILDNMGVSGIINGLRCLIPGVKIVGPAFTVKIITGVCGTYSADDLGGPHRDDFLREGDIFVSDMGGCQISGMGDLRALALRLKGIAGAVIDGGVRDVELITREGFPVYARHVCATSGKTRAKWVGINVPIQVGGVRVDPGDIIVADDTSIAVVPADKAEQILREGQRLEKVEEEFRSELRKGQMFDEVSKKLGGRR